MQLAAGGRALGGLRGQESDEGQSSPRGKLLARRAAPRSAAGGTVDRSTGFEGHPLRRCDDLDEACEFFDLRKWGASRGPGRADSFDPPPRLAGAWREIGIGSRGVGL